MIQRRFFLVSASALALSACGGNLIGPPDAGPMYVVGPKFPPPSAGGEKVAWALAIMHPDMGPGLDTDRIALFQPDGTMDYYAKATYPDRLPTIVQQALVDGFDASAGSMRWPRNRTPCTPITISPSSQGFRRPLQPAGRYSHRQRQHHRQAQHRAWPGDRGRASPPPRPALLRPTARAPPPRRYSRRLPPPSPTSSTGR